MKSSIFYLRKHIRYPVTDAIHAAEGDDQGPESTRGRYGPDFRPAVAAGAPGHANHLGIPSNSNAKPHVSE